MKGGSRGLVGVYKAGVHRVVERGVCTGRVCASGFVLFTTNYFSTSICMHIYLQGHLCFPICEKNHLKGTYLIQFVEMDYSKRKQLLVEKKALKFMTCKDVTLCTIV